jgi:hypothetical protein
MILPLKESAEHEGPFPDRKVRFLISRARSQIGSDRADHTHRIQIGQSGHVPDSNH